jgi:hypothetical protein
MLLFS